LKGDSTEAALKAALLRSEAAETALRREREMQDTVATMARIGGWELDLATMAPIWSDAVYRIHEMDPASRPSLREALNFFTPEARPAIEQAVREALEHGKPYDLTVPLTTGTGKRLWARIMGVAETRNGVVTRLYGAMQDVTAQREAEEIRLAALAAEAAASRAKADFLANMSHEIRTPMNGVIGMTELLLDTALQATQREFAETIRSSATSLLGIVNDILDFSKIESGKLEIERVDMSVRECVEDVGMTLAAQAVGRDVEVIVNVDPGVPDRVLGDAVRLRQVLMNLAGNALKFTQSGEVAIEVFPIALRAGRALLSFEVRDSGIGMEPETIKGLFEPFTQGDTSSTRQHGGTGLGLTIVRGLVDLMDGQLDVSSSPGKGSIFTFTLPFDAIYDAVDPTSTVRVSQQGRRVLVMDDNATNRRVLRGQLQPAGLAVTEAATGADTMESLRKGRETGEAFDVVIVDDQMPDCDGLAFAAQVKASPGLASTPLILLTSLERTDSVKSLASAGFSAYLTKPVRGRELLACIERVLDQGSSSGRFQGLVTRSSLAAEQGQGSYRGRVLVVEDNAVNQQVAKRFIERLGCEVTLVDNGERAVEACRSTDFNLVLMDVQMPVMDGLAATQLIRKLEGSVRRVPIIALTASAMTDEVERCLAAGMNAVLAKPLEIGKLRELLEQHGFRAGGTAPAAAPEEPAPAPPATNPLDLDQLRGIVGDDSDFLKELCDTFVSSSARIVEDMGQALSQGDSASLSSLAHKLKGGSSSVCAHELAKLAASLEKEAKEQPAQELAPAVAAVKRAFDAAAGYVASQVSA
jgi:two-component system sensor histidine kinase/response regulator